MTPGREVAGTVDEVGSGVDPRLVGQSVVADLGLAGGGYAQLAIAAVESLHAVPTGMDFDQAVAMVGTGRTAMAILELAAPTVEDVAVVTAAAGGIGTLLIQALHGAGATVIGLARGEGKPDVIRRLGAVAIDYAGQDWPARTRTAVGDRPISLALDGVGGSIGRAVLELLAVNGRLVMFGTAAGAPTELSANDLYTRGITASAAVGARILNRTQGLRPLEERALRAAHDGTVLPIIGQTFTLADAVAAHRAMESRSTIGKTILHP